MSKVRRGLAVVAGMILLGSCTTPSDRRTVQPLPPSSIQRPATPQSGRVPDRQSFSYSGNLIQGGLVIGIAPTGTDILSVDGVRVPVAPDGRFVIGFDRDAGPQATLSAMLADGRLVRETLTIAPRAWNVSRLDSLPRFPVPAPAFAAIRPAELAQINAARQSDAGSQGWRQRFAWPATGRISTLFGSQRIYKNGEAGAYHSGIDIAVAVGTPVLAPADGVVILASDHPFTLEGNLLMIDHGMGLNSAFMHLSRIDVRVGDTVRRGQSIAASGMTGRATGPHLHWGLKWRNARIDPLLVAGAMSDSGLRGVIGINRVDP